jgi:heptosyltransferase-3
VSLPAVRAIRAGYPDHRLVLVTPVQSGNLVSPLEILGATKLFSEVLFYVSPSAGSGAWVQSMNLAIKIRRLNPDAFFYFRDLPWNHFRRDKFFFQVLGGIRNSYGLDGSNDISGRVASSRSPLYPEVDRLLDIVASAGRAVPAPEEIDFALPISERETSRVDLLWRQLGIQQDELIIGFGPGSNMPAKQWPLDRYMQVGKYLLSALPHSRIAVFGAPEELPLGEEIKRALGDRVVNFAGLLNVLESAEGLRRCSLYVGNDNGAMHLAAAMGTRCIAIFSARDQRGRWEPYGRNHIVLRKDPDCAGCFLHSCTERGMNCIKEISLEEVLEAIGKVLAQYDHGACGVKGWKLRLQIDA